MTDKSRDAAQQDIRCQCCGYMTYHREHLGCIRAALAEQTAQSPTPDWISYNKHGDVLTIRGRRYDAALFDERGFGSPPGTLLRIVDGPADVVTLERVAEQQDAQAVPQEPCAVVKWQTGGPVVHIIGEIQVGDLLYRAAPTPPAPGMAVQALAGEIVEALLADEKDGGYDLAAGLFGPAFSGLVRRWAAAEFAALKAPAAGSDSGGTT